MAAIAMSWRRCQRSGRGLGVFRKGSCIRRRCGTEPPDAYQKQAFSVSSSQVCIRAT